MKLFLVVVALTCLYSCKKDKRGLEATGTVVSKGGCFADSWLVAINNPDLSRQPFLRPAVVSSCAGCYDCSNAVFISLSGELAKAGTMVRFTYARTEVSCLSFSEAPNHITVKKISPL